MPLCLLKLPNDVAYSDETTGFQCVPCIICFSPFVLRLSVMRRGWSMHEPANRICLYSLGPVYTRPDEC